MDQNPWSTSPLTHEDLKQIEATNLEALDRHYLRLLAHCLFWFKEISNNCLDGPLPNKQKRLEWCLNQPSLAEDQAFLAVLLEQLSVAGRQLEVLAESLCKSPLSLTIEDLIESRLSSAISSADKSK